jgi:hypothetical protein
MDNEVTNSAPKRGRPRVIREQVREVKDALAAAPEPVAEPVLERHDMRPEMRPEMRVEDPRTAAARRAAEIRDHLGGMDEGTDDFYIDISVIPPGWDYEWKRHSVMGQQDPAYQVQLARMGWMPVPSHRHPELMPSDWKGATIERKGQILMERPKEISDEARNIERRKARNQVQQKEAQLNASPDGQFGRDNKGNPLVKVGKSYEAIPIPKD